VRGHYLAIHSHRGLVIAQLSLMLRVRYVVHLMTTQLATGNPRVACAHFFDLGAKVVRTTTVPPLVKAELLPIADE
jgi:hypothetical protein